MASATQQQQHRRAMAVVLAVLLTAMPMRAAAGGCEGDKFPEGRSYAHCAALPKLGARLHWTHDATTGSLSVAFVARPAGAGGAGWVSWAVNPTGDGMKGAQALVAFRPSPAAPYAVNTYNITGYKPFGASSTPIAFRPTELAADAAPAAGEVRLYGKLQLPPGTQVVNHLWQVGSAVTAGAPAKHAFDKDNLEAKGKLALSGAALAPASAPAVAGAGGSAAAEQGGSAGGGAKPSSAKAAAAAPVLMLLAVAVGFMATV